MAKENLRWIVLQREAEIARLQAALRDDFTRECLALDRSRGGENRSPVVACCVFS